MFWLIAARFYVHLHRLIGRTFGVYIPGLGWLCRRITLEHVIEAQGRRYFFSRRGASMYSYLIAGIFPEPETHRFFDQVFPALAARRLLFIDVGAAIGEMVMDAARHANVVRVVGFEPDPDLTAACRLSACVNGFDTVEMRTKPLSDTAGPLKFTMQSQHGSSGSIAEDGGGAVVQAGSLDTEFAALEADVHPVLLIDVEGAELRVLRGGRTFIRDTKPLIIFEFNYVSRAHFTLDEMREELGEAYAIYRLRSDGKLDEDFSTTWNCVAIHRESVFEPPSHEWMAKPTTSKAQ